MPILVTDNVEPEIAFKHWDSILLRVNDEDYLSTLIMAIRWFRKNLCRKERFVYLYKLSAIVKKERGYEFYDELVLQHILPFLEDDYLKVEIFEEANERKKYEITLGGRTGFLH